MVETFRPFKTLALDVIREHLRQTDEGKHISIGLEEKPVLLGHGFLMNIEEQHPVLGLGIALSVQGRGWGRKLMGVVIESARQSGVRHMTLTVVKHNKPAVELYKSFGFIIAADHTYLKPNDSYLMCYEEERS